MKPFVSKCKREGMSGRSKKRVRCRLAISAGTEKGTRIRALKSHKEKRKGLKKSRGD